MSFEELITSGSAITILAAIIIAFYSGKVTTSSSSDARVETINQMWMERFADERAEKEAWKAQAQQLAPSVASMAEELEAANTRDEEWKRAMMQQISGAPDRRRPSEPS